MSQDAIRRLQCGHTRLRIESAVLGTVLLASGPYQMHRDILEIKTFALQRDSNAVRRRAAPVAMQTQAAHRAPGRIEPILIVKFCSIISVLYLDAS